MGRTVYLGKETEKTDDECERSSEHGSEAFVEGDRTRQYLRFRREDLGKL